MILYIFVLAGGLMALLVLFTDFISVLPVRRMTVMATDSAAHAGAEAIAERLTVDRTTLTSCTNDPQGWLDRWVQNDYVYGWVMRGGARSVGVNTARSYAAQNHASPINGTPRAWYTYDRWKERIKGTSVTTPAWRVYVETRKKTPNIVGSDETDVRARAEAIAYPSTERRRLRGWYTFVSCCGKHCHTQIYRLHLHAEWYVTIAK